MTILSKFVLPVVLSVLLFVSCSGSGERPADRPFVPGGVTLHFEPHPEWIEEGPSSAMRHSQYRLPADGQEDAEVAVFFFQGQGGSVEDNIDRWIGQFSRPDGSPAAADARVTRDEVDGIPLTLVDVRGTYAQMTGPFVGGQTRPRPGFRMIAAVAETPSGPWFFRLTGPEAVVDRWEDSFQEFLKSIRTS